MAKLGLVKVGSVHLSPREIVAIEPSADQGSIVTYRTGPRVGIPDTPPETVRAALEKAINQGIPPTAYWPPV